jgi:hypothetical protein
MMDALELIQQGRIDDVLKMVDPEYRTKEDIIRQYHEYYGGDHGNQIEIHRTNDLQFREDNY